MAWGDNTAAALAAIPMQLEQIMHELRAGLAESHNARPIDAARYLPADGRPYAWGGTGRLVGWSVRAVGGDVKLTIRDGHDETADIVAVVDVPAGESRTAGLPGSGIAITEALYLQRTGAGQLEGAVWLGVVD